MKLLTKIIILREVKKNLLFKKQKFSSSTLSWHIINTIGKLMCIKKYTKAKSVYAKCFDEEMKGRKIDTGFDSNQKNVKKINTFIKKYTPKEFRRLKLRFQ